MSLNPVDLFQRAAEEARGLLGAGAGLAADAAASAIAAPDRTGPIPDLGKEAARGVCRRYGGNPSGVSGRLAAGLERVCRPYLDDLSPGGGAGVKLPFRGGQCAALYRAVGNFSFSVTPCSTGETFPGQFVLATTGFTLQGPLGGISVTYDLPGACGPTRGILTVQTATGPSVIASFQNPGGNRVSAGFFDGVFEIAPGLTDSCGNPPPVIEPPDPTPTPGPFPFPYNPGPDIDIDIDIDFGPGGDINIDFGTGPISIDPFGDGGGGGGGAGGGGGSGVAPGDLGEAGEDAETGEGGDAEGEAPPNSVLVGLRVDILQTPQIVNRYDPQVLRGVCYVYMGVGDNLALDATGVAVRSGQFFLAPLDFLTTWRVRANFGFRLNVTPYYREREAEQV